MKILVLNCGSSSIKYKLFDMTTKAVLAQGGIEKIGLKGSFLKLTLPDGEKGYSREGHSGTYRGCGVHLPDFDQREIWCIEVAQ